MSPALRLAVPAVLLALGACTTPNTKIEGRDTATLLPAARVSIDLLVDRSAPPPEKPPERPRGNDFHLLLDIDGSYGEGGFTEHVVPPDVISVGGPQFTGDVDVDFSIERGTLAVRAANRFRNGIDIDGFLGLSHTKFEIELSQGGTSDEDDHDMWGPIAGVMLGVRPIDWLRLFAEGSIGFGSASKVDSISIRTIDVGAAFLLGRHVELVGGWRSIKYEAEVDDFVASDLELELTGPMLAVHVVL